jgi:hemerythrin
VICVDDEASNESLKTNSSISARYIIDEDHEQIDLKLKALKDSIIRSKGLPMIFESAESLIAKTLEHFQHEEKILESVEYQGLPKHRAAHEVISREFTRDEERTRATPDLGSTGPYEVLPRSVAQAFATGRK